MQHSLKVAAVSQKSSAAWAQCLSMKGSRTSRLLVLPGNGAGSAPPLYFPPVLHGRDLLRVLEGTLKLKGFAGEHLLLLGSKPSVWWFLLE